MLRIVQVIGDDQRFSTGAKPYLGNRLVNNFDDYNRLKLGAEGYDHLNYTVLGSDVTESWKTISRNDDPNAAFIWYSYDASNQADIAMLNQLKMIADRLHGMLVISHKSSS